jgi:hypothetical protein
LVKAAKAIGIDGCMSVYPWWVPFLRRCRETQTRAA